MSKMKSLKADIDELLDTTYMLCQEIADTLGCDITLVEQVVHQRWIKRIGGSL